MKVALLRNMREEGFRSIEVYADRLAASLRSLAPEVEFSEVRVDAWRWPDLRFPTPYGRQASLRTLGLYLSRWVRYGYALRGVKADVYHVLDNSYGHLAAFLDPQRTAVTTHGGTPLGYRHWNPEGPALWLFDVAFRLMLRTARIVAVSEFAKQELLAECRYPADRIQVVHHGVDPAFRRLPERERSRWRARLQQPSDRAVLLHVGHAGARKNVETLYRALCLLHEGGVPAQLLRVGGMPTAQQARLIDGLGLQGAVTHIEHVPHRGLPAYYAAADALVFPSLYENFGLPLIEAMACGTPVICSDLAVFHEVCGDAARFADPRQPESLVAGISSVLTDPGLASSLRAKGLERALLFTWEQAAQKTLSLYRSLVDAP